MGSLLAKLVDAVLGFGGSSDDRVVPLELEEVVTVEEVNEEEEPWWPIWVEFMEGMKKEGHICETEWVVRTLKASCKSEWEAMEECKELDAQEAEWERKRVEWRVEWQEARKGIEEFKKRLEEEWMAEEAEVVRKEEERKRREGEEKRLQLEKRRADREEWLRNPELAWQRAYALTFPEDFPPSNFNNEGQHETS